MYCTAIHKHRLSSVDVSLLGLSLNNGRGSKNLWLLNFLRKFVKLYGAGADVLYPELSWAGHTAHVHLGQLVRPTAIKFGLEEGFINSYHIEIVLKEGLKVQKGA